MEGENRSNVHRQRARGNPWIHYEFVHRQTPSQVPRIARRRTLQPKESSGPCGIAHYGVAHYGITHCGVTHGNGVITIGPHIILCERHINLFTGEYPFQYRAGSCSSSNVHSIETRCIGWALFARFSLDSCVIRSDTFLALARHARAHDRVAITRVHHRSTAHWHFSRVFACSVDVDELSNPTLSPTTLRIRLLSQL